VTEKFEFVDAEYAAYRGSDDIYVPSVVKMCRWMEVSRSQCHLDKLGRERAPDFNDRIVMAACLACLLCRVAAAPVFLDDARIGSPAAAFSHPLEDLCDGHRGRGR
jgi:hypothetical protein